MSVAPTRGVRFLLPGLEASDEFAGLQAAPTGGLAMVDGDEAIRQAIFVLISTSLGERVMRPTYGCGLHRLIHAPNDDTTAGLAIHYVKRALDRWEPRVDVLHVDATPNPWSPERLDIKVHYRVRATLRRGRLEYPLELDAQRAP